MKKYSNYLFSFLLVGFVACSKESPNLDLALSEEIKINQIGFYPDKEKWAVITSDSLTKVFFIVDEESQEIKYKGELSGPVTSALTNKPTHLAEFSQFTEHGSYTLNIPGLGKSHPFIIGDEIFEDLGKGVLKAFYYQRASLELPEQFAGLWARPAGHPDDQVMVHPSAVSAERPENTIVSAPFGWYDAGDYNKYMVNSGITMGTLLSLYEDFPQYFSAQNLNIPESGNEVPDLLDEVLWNLKWMIQMQDPHDGGVYHKLTTARFEGLVMPHEAKNQRYVVAKSTAATLNFAAVMAQASRVYEDFYPELAIECLKGAEKAWLWAKENPDMFYEQNEINQKFQPAIQTGAYGNGQLADERNWAATELYISTRNPIYLDGIVTPDQNFLLPNWGNVGWLGYYSILRFRDELKNVPPELIAQVKHLLLQEAENYANAGVSSNYRVVMGHKSSDFVWGSNAVAANQGIALIQAYLITGKVDYINHAVGNLDYIVGRNPTNYSFVISFGSKTPQNPHHRPSGSDSHTQPIPGFVVGGPNPGQQDDCKYPSMLPAESYVDDYCSYASNEVAINWNAPLAYLVNALEAIGHKK